MLSSISDSQMLEWLQYTFSDAPHLQLTKRKPIPSFQQQLEMVTLQIEREGAEIKEVTVFVRVYRGLFSSWTLAAPDLPKRELTAWNVANRAGLPIPELLYLSQGEDFSVAIQSCLSGKSVGQVHNDVVIRHLAELLARLHCTPIGEQDAIQLPDVSLSKLLARIASWADESDDVEVIEKVKVIANQSRKIEERPGVLIHGDCHPGNFLSDGQSITAMLDWEDSAIGDPRVDVARMDKCLRRLGSADLADLFLQTYQDKADFELGPLSFWVELWRVRDQSVGSWMAHRFIHDLPLPPSNYDSWIHYLGLNDYPD